MQILLNVSPLRCFSLISLISKISNRHFVVIVVGICGFFFTRSQYITSESELKEPEEKMYALVEEQRQQTNNQAKQKKEEKTD